MKTTVSYKNTPSSASLTEHVENLATEMATDRYKGDEVRVTVEAPSRHHAHGAPFEVHARFHAFRHTFVATGEDLDPYRAVNQTFDALKKQVEHLQTRYKKRDHRVA